MTDHGRDEPRQQKRRGFVSRVARRFGWAGIAMVMGAVAIVSLFVEEGPPRIELPAGFDEVNLAAFQRPPQIPPPPAPPPVPTTAQKTDESAPPVVQDHGYVPKAEPTENRKRQSFALPRTEDGGGRKQPAAGRPERPDLEKAGRGGTTIAFRDETIPGRRAGRAVDTTLMLAPGKYDFVLDVDVSSERKGPFFAHAKRDIRSAAGVVLIEEGTTISGTYESEVGEGQSRVTMVAASGITQNGIPFVIGAPMGDGRGRVGVDGHLNTNTWPKLRNAAFLMAAQGTTQAVNSAIQAALQRSGGTNFNFSTGSLDSALVEAIRAGSRVQSTVELSAGKTVSILVTEPIFFDDSYALEVR